MWPQWQANPTEKPACSLRILTGICGLDLFLTVHIILITQMQYSEDGTISVPEALQIWDITACFLLFLALGINTPAISAESHATTTCALNGNVSVGVKNDVAFPLSCIVRFKFNAQPELPPFELFWYDGGMKPVDSR